MSERVENQLALALLLVIAGLAACGKSRRPGPVAVLAPQATVAALASLKLVADSAAATYGVSDVTVTVTLAPGWPACSALPQGPHVGYTHADGSVEITCPHAWPHEALHALGVGDLAHADPRWGQPYAGIARGEFGGWIARELVTVYGRDPWEVLR